MATSKRLDLRQVFKPWPIRPWPMMAVLTLFELMVNLAGFTPPVFSDGRWQRLDEFLATMPSVFFGIAFGLPMLLAAQMLTGKSQRFAGLIYWLTGPLLGLVIALSRTITITDLTPEVWNYPNASVRITVATSALFLIVHVSLGLSNVKFARQVKVAEAATQSLAIQRGRLISAQEDVRRQVADFLHDRLQSDLVLLGMQLQSFIANLNEHDRSVAQAYIDEIERIRQFEVRGVSKQLAPEFAGPYFTPALEDLISRYAKAIHIQLDVSEQGKLPELARLACFRIVEQALLNAAKHGAATEVLIEVYELANELTIKVLNNGAKLPKNPVAGAGFATIDEWVGQFNGTWSLKPNNDQTELLVNLSF